MASDFNTFKTTIDYKAENLLDTDSWTQKKIYSDAPFIVLPQLRFNIKLGSLSPAFVCFIRTRGEQFGDAVGFDLTNKVVKIFVYNDKNNLILREPMLVTNIRLGEVAYNWKEFDLQFTGFYTCEIQITGASNEILILPSHQPRIEIIVS